MSARRAVFLDRDGVLNRAFFQADGKTHPPSTPGELEILPGVVEACRTLRRAGFLLIVVTNQPDVARGAQCRQVVEAINAELCRQVPVDDVRVCYHDNADDCGCRKPRPGLLLEAAKDWGVDLADSFMIGDRWKDIEAGRRAGCRTVLVNGACGQEAPGEPDWAARGKPDHEAGSLAEAVDWVPKRQAASPRGGDQE